MKWYFLNLAFLVVIAGLIVLVNHLNHIFLIPAYQSIEVNGNKVLFREQPQDYISNPHVVFDVQVDGDRNYQFGLKFRGPQKRDWNWNWSYIEKVTDESILRFGIPKSMFEPYYPVDSVIKKRNEQMNRGMFVQDGRYLKPDLNTMINYYRPFLEPIAKLTHETLGESESWRGGMEFLVKFCQDIPYGIPPKYFNDKYIGGVFPPPQVFVNKFGDCDSKVVVFASAASYFEETEVLLLYETGHVIPAVKGVPKPYDAYYTYKNENYIMADTAGPGRSALGMVTNPYQKINKVEPVVIKK